jgi:hypothetical protein
MLIGTICLATGAERAPTQAIFLNPSAGDKLSGYQIIRLRIQNRAIALREVAVEYRQGKDQEWHLIGRCRDPVALLDTVEVGWDTRQLPPGEYSLRSSGLTDKRRVFLDSTTVEIRQDQGEGEQPPRKTDFCKCENMEILSEDEPIPADSGLKFDETRSIGSDARKLGQNVDTEDHLETVPNGHGGLKQTLVKNFRLNFMVDALLVDGSKPGKCSEEQQVKS